MKTDTEPGKGSLISAMFLVAGCCIGGGMLALPVGSGVGGFFPSILAMALSWFCMTASALLLMEVSLWMDEGAHIITMTSRLLGPIGKAVAWVLFLYISYASQVAYAAGGGVQIASLFSNYFDFPMTKEMGAAFVTVVFTTVIVFGGQIVGRVNSLFFTALIFAYFAVLGFGAGEVKSSLLLHKHWSAAWLAIPVLLTAFSFQTMVPSLTPILKRHTNALRFSIIGGTTIAFVVYAVWQALILGIVPVDGTHGLLEANVRSVPPTEFIRSHVESSLFVLIAEFFGFFAIITSFLAIGLGLFDFLSDGLHIKEKGKGNLALWLLMVVPTLICAVKFERAFMFAMETSGGYGDTILNGMIPVLMVWIGRYHLGYSGGYRVPGGKALLIGVFIFFFGSLCLEVSMQTGILPTSYEVYDILEVHNVDEIIKE
ncbi:MAG: aromatic amino acid transport family protein [Chlamydiota bacterium]|nr:aromatic amino acid transport family protein [Chlamydiota bacterium]